MHDFFCLVSTIVYIQSDAFNVKYILIYFRIYFFNLHEILSRIRGKILMELSKTMW
jgi:hypothetical protein